ncbi:hypothetical protein FN846DRAFT_982093 [Sphaerosporella brunnea]|uniref:Uncharacterized protein n=1 Tax=Sphaerosporella brunnea TaxID=1250544 RepID=A0A5J5EC12_9PEZI|nr:hypothetical protein FN846DRAFT_982093 [Sphaerosporella brunnea]
MSSGVRLFFYRDGSHGFWAFFLALFSAWPILARHFLLLLLLSLRFAHCASLLFIFMRETWIIGGGFITWDLGDWDGIGWESGSGGRGSMRE